MVALAGNAMQTLSEVRRQASRGFLPLQFALGRLLPKKVASALGGALKSTPLEAALFAAVSGDTANAREMLREAAEAGKVDAAVIVAVMIHQPSLARELAGEGMPGLAPSTRALVLAEEGHYEAALCEISVGHARLRAQIEGERDVYDVESRIGVPTAALSTSQPIRRVYHLVTTALPEAHSGYTQRSQGIGTAQQRAGKTIRFTTRIGFPVDQGRPFANPRVHVDGVEYRRLLGKALPATLSERLDRNVAAVRADVQDWRPDILHAHSKHDNAQIALAIGRSEGIPVVYEVRGFLEETWVSRGGEKDSDRYRLARAAETTCMLAADAVITLSESMRDEIVSRGVPHEQVFVIPNAVDPLFLTDIQRSERSPGSPFVVGMCGTLNHYEGLDVLLRAVAQLGRPEVEALIVGDGPARASLEALAKELEIPARFTGRVPHAEVPGHIDQLDLYCVPRRATPVTALVPPLKPVEALARAVPVMASDLPPLRELALASGAVRCVAADDVEAWARALGEALSDEARLRHDGESGRQWVAAERTWARMAETCDTVYDHAIAHRTSRAERREAS